MLYVVLQREGQCTHARPISYWYFELIDLFLELDCFVRHAWFALTVFSRDGIFLLEAGGILSLCNYSWKFDWRLFCYARMVSAVCFLWKFLAWGRWNFEVVHWDIVLLRTHGVPLCVSFVLENACLRRVEFWACVIILENLTGDCFVIHDTALVWNYPVPEELRGIQT